MVRSVFTHTRMWTRSLLTRARTPAHSTQNLTRRESQAILILLFEGGGGGGGGGETDDDDCDGGGGGRRGSGGECRVGDDDRAGDGGFSDAGGGGGNGSFSNGSALSSKWYGRDSFKNSGGGGFDAHGGSGRSDCNSAGASGTNCMSGECGPRVYDSSGGSGDGWPEVRCNGGESDADDDDWGVVGGRGRLTFRDFCAAVVGEVQTVHTRAPSHNLTSTV